MKPRHSQEVKAAANKRFSELAMPMTVSAELKIPYDTIYGWWRKHQGHPITRKAKVITPGDCADVRGGDGC